MTAANTSSCQITSWANSPVKRFLDVLFSVLALVVISPFLVLAAIGVRLSSPGPIFFRHTRAGRHGTPIDVLKLRTMREPPSGAIARLTDPDDESRLTHFGRFLRRFSIDELPQFINVLRGDMSIVGPRPLPVEYVERYSDAQRCRLLARPGLTGLSQVKVRNGGGWDEKLSLDAKYISRASFILDFRILLGTIRTVLSGSGVSAPRHATMPEFKKEQNEHDR